MTVNVPALQEVVSARPIDISPALLLQAQKELDSLVQKVNEHQVELEKRLADQHYADEGRFRAFADRHGWCPDGGMTSERCALSVCDCGYEGQTWNLMRARAEAAEAALAEERAKTGRAEWGVTDRVTVELGQHLYWDGVIRASREEAVADFLNDGDDVLIRRFVGPWEPA